MVLGGRQHELPIIVVSCIEELYRTGEPFPPPPSLVTLG